MFLVVLLLGQAAAELANIEMSPDGTTLAINAGAGKAVAVTPALRLGSIDNVETALTRAASDAEALEDRVNTLTTGLEDASNTAALAAEKTTQEFKSVKATVATLATAVDGKNVATDDAVEQLSREDDKHQATLDAHATKLEAHDASLAAQGKSLQKCNADLQTLQDIVDELNATVAVLNATWTDENGAGAACNALGATAGEPAVNCYALHVACPQLETGLYWVTGNSGKSAFKVQCDMTYGGGGWTLVHRANNKDHSSRQRCAQMTLRGEGGCTKDDGNEGAQSTVALAKFGGKSVHHTGGFCAYDKDTINSLRTSTDTLGAHTAGMRMGLDSTGTADMCSVFRYFKSECVYKVGDSNSGNNMGNNDVCKYFKMSASKEEVDKDATTLDDVTTWTASSCSGGWSAPGIRNCNNNPDYSAYCERDNNLDKDDIRGCNRICLGMITFFDSNSCYDPWGFGGRAQGKAGTFWVR